jgi:hypothetical protein
MLDHIFPRADYAEEQQYAKTILTTHVLHRSLNVGGVLGLARVGASSIWHRYRGTAGIASTPTLLAVSKTTIWTTVFVSAALGARMYSKDAIEWQDRSWRLLGHPTQRAVDEWSTVGAVSGAIVGAGLKGKGNVGIMSRGFGGAAIGSLIGVVALETYRRIEGAKKESAESE